MKMVGNCTLLLELPPFSFFYNNLFSHLLQDTQWPFLFLCLSPGLFLNIFFFTFQSFKALGLKKMKKADLKCSGEFTACKKSSENQNWEKNYRKAQCTGHRRLKKRLSKTNFPFEKYSIKMFQLLLSPVSSVSYVLTLK